GDAYGVDFNPVADRIRVVNDADENLRLDPNTGARTDALMLDQDLTPSGHEVAAVAYTAANPTTLYALSATSLERITNGNNGTLVPVGPTGAGTTLVRGLNFDISPSGEAFATAVASGLGVPGLYRVDLGSGALTALGRTPTVLDGLASAPVSAVTFGAPAF